MVKSSFPGEILALQVLVAGSPYRHAMALRAWVDRWLQGLVRPWPSWELLGVFSKRDAMEDASHVVRFEAANIGVYIYISYKWCMCVYIYIYMYLHHHLDYTDESWICWVRWTLYIVLNQSGSRCKTTKSQFGLAKLRFRVCKSQWFC